MLRCGSVSKPKLVIILKNFVIVECHISSGALERRAVGTLELLAVDMKTRACIFKHGFSGVHCVWNLCPLWMFSRRSQVRINFGGYIGQIIRALSLTILYQGHCSC